MSDRLQLGIYGHAVPDGSGCAFYWSIFDLNAASEYIVNSGCGRDKRDIVTGAWVAVGKACGWLKQTGRTPRSVTIVARAEVVRHEPTFAVHVAMKARITEYIECLQFEGVSPNLVWDSASESDLRVMTAECQADLRMMQRAEALSAEGKPSGENRS